MHIPIVTVWRKQWDSWRVQCNHRLMEAKSATSTISMEENDYSVPASVYWFRILKYIWTFLWLFIVFMRHIKSFMFRISPFFSLLKSCKRFNEEGAEEFNIGKQQNNMVENHINQTLGCDPLSVRFHLRYLFITF